MPTLHILLIHLCALFIINGVQSLPCGISPINGETHRTSGDIYQFKCVNSSYLLQGPTSASCRDNVLDITHPPTCSYMHPKVTRLWFSYYQPCEGRSKRHTDILNLIQRVDCMMDNTCSMRTIQSLCKADNHIYVHAMFDTQQNRTAEQSIHNFVATVLSRGTRGLHSREKRFDFSNPDDGGSSSGCDDGQEEKNNACVNCNAGNYEKEKTCTICAYDTYQPAQKQTSCTNCTDGKQTTLMGQTTADSCKEICVSPTSLSQIQYTVDNVAQAASYRFGVGSIVTLLCSSGYTYDNQGSQSLTCSSSNKGSLPSECYSVTLTDSQVYNTGTASSVTCKIQSSVEPSSIKWYSGSSLYTEGTEGSTVWNSTNKNGTQVNTITAAGTYTCGAVINGKEEKSTETTKINVLSFEISAESTINAGDTFTITAKATYSVDLPQTSFSWTKDGSTDTTSRTNSKDANYFYSKLIISGATKDNMGTYAATVSFKDSNLNVKGTGTKDMKLYVRAFTINPADNFTTPGAAQQIIASNSELKLTCAAVGATSKMTINWYKGSTKLTTGAADSFDAGTGTTTSIYTKANAQSAEGGDYTCKIMDSSTVLLASSAVKISVSSLSVEQGATARFGQIGLKATLTCTASNPSSLSTTPSVTWYKDSISAAIQDNSTYSTTSDVKTTANKLTSTLIMPTLAYSYNGVYYCKAFYADYTTTLTVDSKTTFVVRGYDAIAVQFKQVGEESLFSTKFYGGDPLTKEWRYSGTKLGSPFVQTATYDSSSQSTTFTLKTTALAANSVTSYDAFVEYKTSTDIPNLQVTGSVYLLTVNSTVKAAVVSEGDDIVITCNYANPTPLDVTPTISWLFKASAITSPSVNEAGKNLEPIASNILTVSSAKQSNIGTYACRADYGKYTPSTKPKSTDVSVTVRGFVAMADQSVAAGKDAVFTCKFYGGAGTIVWKNSDVITSSTARYTVTGIPYDSGTMEQGSKLEIKTLESGDSGNLKCEMTYTSDKNTKTDAVVLTVLTPTITSSDLTISTGETFSLTCSYDNPTSMGLSGAPTVTWFKDDASTTPTSLINTNANDKDTKAKLIGVFTSQTTSGDFQCNVQWESQATSNSSVIVQYVRSASTSPATQYVIKGSNTTITATFLGDVGTVVWTDSSDQNLTNSRYSVGKTGYDTGTFATTSALTITKAVSGDSATFKAVMTYTEATSVKLTTSYELKVLILGDMVSSKQYADKDDPLTLTCTYAHPSGLDVTPVVTWTKGTSTFTNDITTPKAGESVFNVTSAKFTDNGAYSCSLNYGKYGTLKGSPLNQYVRGIPKQTSPSRKLTGNITIDCVAYGDDAGTGKWTKGGNNLTDSRYKQSTAMYSTATFTTTSTLSITDSVIGDSANLTCTFVYKTSPATVTSTLELLVFGVSVTGVTFETKGKPVILTCVYTNHQNTLKWLKNNVTIPNETKDTLTIAKANFTDSAEYKCEIDFADHGSVVSNAHVLFVQGIQSVTIEKNGSNIDEGETVKFYFIVQSLSTPTGGKLLLDGTKDTTVKVTIAAASGTNLYNATAVVTNISTPSSGKQRTVLFSVTAPNSSDDSVNFLNFTEIIDVYALCTLPSIVNMTQLSGQKIKHDVAINDLTCSNNYVVEGSGTVRCNDGTLEWAVGKAQPVCTGIETNPADSVIDVGGSTAFTCITQQTTLSVDSMVWMKGDSDVWNDTAYTSTQYETQKKYKSVYTVLGALSLHKEKYKCKLKIGGATIQSTNATLYIVGFKSTSISMTGSYIESNQVAGEYSEDYTVYLQVYSEPGISSLTAKFTNSNGNVTDVTLTVNKTVENNLITYQYKPPENLKISGEFTMAVNYTGYSTSFGTSIRTYVYQFCNVSSLGNIDHGTFGTSTKIEYKKYAALTCTAKYDPFGTANPACDENGEFVLAQGNPECVAEPVETCGDLPATSNGFIVYNKEKSSGSYVCKSNYIMIGSAETYTCASTTNIWSIVSADNPDGNPPVCQRVIEATSRKAEFNAAELTVNGAGSTYCTTPAQKAALEAILMSFLTSKATCLQKNSCKVTGYLCTSKNGSTTAEVFVDFMLEQITDLWDYSILSDDVDTISSSNFDMSRRRRDTLSRSKREITATGTIPVGTIASTCPTNYISVNGYCIQCPAGYGKNTAGTSCELCGIGYYSGITDISICSTCTTGLSTKSTGSISVSKCVEDNFCIVSTLASDSYGIMVPSSGSRVQDDTTLTITCENGYGMAHKQSGLLKCSSQPAPACYALCDIRMYTQTEQSSRNIILPNSTNSYVSHEETIVISCISKHEFSKDTPIKQLKCIKGVIADFGTCKKTSNETVLITVIVCVVVLGIAIIFLFLFILVQWRKKKNDTYKLKRLSLAIDPIENGAIKLTKVNLMEADKKAPLMSRPVHIADFGKYFDLMTADDDHKLNEEFSTFTTGENNTVYYGSLPENDEKNRYKNILPFDHSRVKLHTTEDNPYSDYINANFIHGYHRPRTFIATQAPLKNTIPDFWKMIWEQKCTMIINLTKLEERGKLKSVEYWPSWSERQSVYANIEIKRISKQEADSYKVYAFEIRNKDGDERRELYIFNYVGWPDYDVPSNSNDFITFVYNIRHLLHVKPRIGPLICHCSAGTGRTGAFISVMNCLDRLTNTDDLDILGLVGSLRQQRWKMVFTEHQYKFIHQAMLDVVTDANFELHKESGFRRKTEVLGVKANPYVTGSLDNDGLESLQDSKV